MLVPYCGTGGVCANAATAAQHSAMPASNAFGVIREKLGFVVIKVSDLWFLKQLARTTKRGVYKLVTVYDVSQIYASGRVYQIG
jgi:hypothetical protein